MRATLYDGLTARARAVVTSIGPDSLAWAGEDANGSIATSRLRRGDKVAGRNVLHRDDDPDWRLVLLEPPPADWLRNLSDVGALSHRARSFYVGAGVLAVAIGLGLWLFGDRLLETTAPLLPHRITQPLGEALVTSLGGKQCSGAAGNAALDRLVARLRPPGGFVEPVRVTVLDTAAVNALAAPGGRVVVFRGLIDKARSPDEVAGVLAHELTHVDLRHPNKALLRQFGVSLLLQSLGGNVGGAADLAVVLSSTRGAERAADRGALALLRQARISPAGLAQFFVRMQAEDKTKQRGATESLIHTIGSYAATHPGSDERAGAVSAAVPQQGAVTPAMSAGDWQALRGICRATARL